MEAQGFFYVENFAWLRLNPKMKEGKFTTLTDFYLEIEARARMDLEGGYTVDNSSILLSCKKTLLIFRRKPKNNKKTDKQLDLRH